MDHEIMLDVCKEKFESGGNLAEERHLAVMKGLKKIDICLSGTNGSPGMRMDVDRLKEKEKQRVWLTRAIVIVILGLVVRVVWKFLVKEGA